MMPGTLTCPVKLGDFARVTTTGYAGRVYGIHTGGCPEDGGWLALQAYLTDEEKQEYTWVSILTTGGGSVVAPASTVKHLTRGIPNFEHPWADFYFRD
jgi:hypothetical protein